MKQLLRYKFILWCFFCSVIPYSSISFSAVPDEVQTIFASNTCLDCHSGNTPSGNLSLDDANISETALVDITANCSNNNAKLVEPGDAPNSVLYQKLSNQNINCGGVMPPSGNLISDSDLNIIFDWIVSIGSAGQSGLIEMQETTVLVQETDPDVTLIVARQLGLQGQVTVDYTVSSVGNDGAESPSDFVSQTGTLTFENNESSKDIIVVLADDEEFEGDEVFSVTLSNPTNGAVLGRESQSKVTITDNEVENLPGTFFFDRASYSGDEGIGELQITVIRSFGTAGQVTVDLISSNGSAIAGSDYQVINQTLVFEDGERSSIIPITFLDDQIEEDSESFTLGLSNPTAGSLIGSTQSLVVTIIDNDATSGGDGGNDGGSDGGDTGAGSGTTPEVPVVEAEYEAAGAFYYLILLLLTLPFMRNRCR